MSFVGVLRVTAMTTAIASVTACGIITFSPGTGTSPKRPDFPDSLHVPKPSPIREDCTRHIVAAHQALATIGTDSTHASAIAHHMAMHDYHVCLTKP